MIQLGGRSCIILSMSLVFPRNWCLKETCSTVRVGMFPINGLDSDSVRAGRSEDRIPAEARFSAPVQTGPGAYPASYTTGTGSFPGVKRSGRGVDHPPPSSAEVKERLELTSTPPTGLRGLF